jgi:hypothetical protein
MFELAYSIGGNSPAAAIIAGILQTLRAAADGGGLLHTTAVTADAPVHKAL